MPDLLIRTALEQRKIGAASQGSPLRNPLSPSQVLNNAITAGLTGGIKGALVVSGDFDVYSVGGSPNLAVGLFSNFTKDTSRSFLDTTYFNLDAVNSRIEVIKPCYFLVTASGKITLANGGGLFQLQLSINSVTGSMYQKLCLPGLTWAACGPLMMAGNIGDYLLMVFATINAVGDAATGTGGTCEMQFLVVG